MISDGLREMSRRVNRNLGTLLCYYYFKDYNRLSDQHCHPDRHGVTDVKIPLNFDNKLNLQLGSIAGQLSNQPNPVPVSTCIKHIVLSQRNSRICLGEVRFCQTNT